MTIRHCFSSLCLLAGATVLMTITQAQDVPAPPVPNLPGAKPDVPEKGIQVENRGPVHEAFANPGAPVRGKEGMFADKAPPPPVPELPPDEKPSGENVQWISGYWQWDLEKKDFIWVSGFWRNTPPGRSWAAGEWRVENGQHRYIPGFWRPSNENSRRIDLPEPPKTVENGPNIPAPHKDALWIPGHWVHRNESYVWQPGYWGEVESNMMWTPGQYNYTGSGYCYVPGYWDYCLEDRGLLYAPVYFTEPLWLNAGWRFCPTFGVSVGFGSGWGCGYGGFYDSLFIGPGWGSFWFGGFWGPTCWNTGFRPWCWGGGGGFCNHFYNSHCWQNRGNPNWNSNNQCKFAARNVGAIPGAGQRVAGGRFAGGPSNLNPNSVNVAKNMATKFGGEKMGQQVADRIAKGQTIQQVNHALKQSSSMNVVQPAGQVLKNQTLAQNLPSPTSVRNVPGSATSISRSNDIGTSLRSAVNSGGSTGVKSNLDANRTNFNRPSLAGSNQDAALRRNIDSAIRQAPAGSFTKSSSTRVLPSASGTGGTRNLSGSSGINSSQLSNSGTRSGMSSSTFPGSRGMSGSSNLGSSMGSGMRSSSQSMPGSSSMGSRGSIGSSNMGSYRGSIGSSSMGGSRGSMGGASMGGSRGSMGGGMGGGSRGGGGGGKR